MSEIMRNRQPAAPAKKPLVLMILDGFGVSQDDYGNAIHAAHMPYYKKYLASYPHTTVGASGLDVGLPEGQMGNSEVGHTNLGAGRVVYQELTRIGKSIQDGDFFQNPAFLKAVAHCKENHSALQLFGLLSDGGVHSHNSHLYALLQLAKQAGVEQVFVHCFLDGRDVPPSSGKDFILELEAKMQEIGIGKIASVMGRYYAMDRDSRWERVEKAYAAMVQGEGITTFQTAAEAVAASYEQGVSDEFVLPAVIDPAGRVSSGDALVFFNFRPDRARELTRTFVDPDFTGFARGERPENLYLVCMTQYDATMPNVEFAFHPQNLEDTFGEYISKQGLTQLRIAETEKYAHVTFFFNGGVEKVYPGEERALIHSPKVATYDLQPEMSAIALTNELLDRMASGKYDVIILNYANCDMVGHTGVFRAAVKAVETVDSCMGRVVDQALQMGGTVLVTADHGNADKMYETDGSPFTAHTTNPVPLILIGKGDCQLREGGRLADFAPTMLELLSLPVPPSMTGTSLLLR